MDALTFLKEYKRMCDTNNLNCFGCPMKEAKSKGDYQICRVFIKNHPEEAIKVVEKWVKEHPCKTNADKFKEVFGDKITLERSTYDCAGIDCPISHTCDICPYKNFWSDPYIEREVK